MYAYDAEKYLKYRNEAEDWDLTLEDVIIGDCWVEIDQFIQEEINVAVESRPE